jgi:hypothetical protein
VVKNDASLYQRVVDVTNAYLGPAAERFIARQVQNHLGKSPEELQEADLEKLVDWIKIAIAMLTEDNHVVEELTDKLMRLAHGHKKEGA